MKLRVARKICAAIDTPRESAYTGGQIHRALQRWGRANRHIRRYVRHMLRRQPQGWVVDELVRHGFAGSAFRILMES